jgi:exosome complex exonuclease RRP6
MFNNRQLWAMKEIFAWRFNVAMNEDESTSYVLPNHMLLQISETLPREMQGILACCNPIPALVRQNLATIHRIVLQARQQPLIQVYFKYESS